MSLQIGPIFTICSRTGLRSSHVSWEVDEGVFLIGGYEPESKRSSELVRYDGNVEEAFPLKYDVYSSCAINEGYTVVITGGWGADFKVVRYDRRGWVEDLPDLLTDNVYHACGQYTNSNNQKVKDYSCTYIFPLQSILGLIGYWWSFWPRPHWIHSH